MRRDSELQTLRPESVSRRIRRLVQVQRGGGGGGGCGGGERWVVVVMCVGPQVGTVDRARVPGGTTLKSL